MFCGLQKDPGSYSNSSRRDDGVGAGVVVWSIRLCWLVLVFASHNMPTKQMTMASSVV